MQVYNTQRNPSTSEGRMVKALSFSIGRQGPASQAVLALIAAQMAKKTAGLHGKYSLVAVMWARSTNTKKKPQKDLLPCSTTHNNGSLKVCTVVASHLFRLTHQELHSS